MGKKKDAFKKAFGVGAPSADWAAIEKKARKQRDLCEASVMLLERLNAPTAAAARAAFKATDHAMTLALIDMKVPVVGGPVLRDRILPPLIEQTADNRLAAKETPLKVAVGNPPADVEVFWTDIPEFETMSPAERAKAAQKVAMKAKRGNDLLALMPADGSAPALPPMNRQEKRRAVTDIAWALKSKAEAKVGPYEKGGLTVPRGEALRKFFDSCGEDVYPRRSTHLQDQQKLPGQSPRGMDFYDGADTLDKGEGDGDGLLPCGMNTILMQQVTDTAGNKRMYIKMETASAFGTAGPKNKKDPSAIPGGGRTEKGSLMETINHGLNVFRNTDQHKDLQGHRENTPDIVYDLCKEVIKESSNKQAKAELKALMVKDRDGELQLRVNKFVAKLNFWAPIAFTSQDAKWAIEKLNDELDSQFGADADLAVQAGNEVALSEADLA